MNDKCPWCSANQYRDDYLIWECGSTRLARSPGCYERQLSRMQPVVDAANEYEEQWHSNRNLQPFLHRLRVATYQYKEGE